MRRFSQVAALTWSIVAVAGAAAGAAPTTGLYTFLGRLDAGVPGSPAAVETHRIRVNTEPLEAGADRIVLELLDGSQATAVLTGLERRGAGEVGWRGRLDDPVGGRVVLTLKNGLVIGLVETPDGLYELGVSPDGEQVLSRLDPRLFPECGEAVAPETTAASEAEPPRPGADDPGRIDVMVLYTPQARAGAGGVAAIEADIQFAVDLANTAAVDSNVSPRFNLVHTGLANRNDSGDLEQDLVWLRQSASVASLRDLHAADLVSLIVENGGDYCGIGYVMRDVASWFANWAYQVTDRGCIWNHTWTHETGHNMGMEHDPANSSCGGISGCASYPWSFGHFVSGVFRTIMSYLDECTSYCPRVSHFSNPGVKYAGYRTGIADRRDNHRTANSTAPVIADFRESGRLLTVVLLGSGNGTVTSAPGGINCGPDCQESYASGTVVELTATAAGGSAFVGWGGHADCADGRVTMNADKTCEATFEPQFTLTTSKAGTGSGTITSQPGGINCGGDCQQAYLEGTVVNLSATPASGSAFVGWGGHADCADGTVTMTGDRACEATFMANPTLTVTRGGSGSGKVVSSPPGIDCGGACSAAFPYGSSVGLLAVPDLGSQLAGWGGHADCSEGVVTMDADKTCTATFEPCSIPSEVTVHDETITGVETRQACNTLVVGPKVAIGQPGRVEFRAGNAVIFVEPFEIEEGCQMKVVLGPPL